jgi:hypothetical protein
VWVLAAALIWGGKGVAKLLLHIRREQAAGVHVQGALPAEEEAKIQNTAGRVHTISNQGACILGALRPVLTTFRFITVEEL